MCKYCANGCNIDTISVSKLSIRHTTMDACSIIQTNHMVTSMKIQGLHPIVPQF